MSEAARLAALEQMLQYKKASENYLDFVQTMYPTFVLPDFQVELINALDLLEKRQLFTSTSLNTPVLNLLITMPPRHAKSTWGTINFPAYFQGRDPRRHCMSVSYNSTLAKGFGRSVRQVMSEPMYANIFDTQISSDKRAADSFITTEKGNYYSIGLNGTTTGRAANCLLIDDPFKSRADAESKLIRDRVWDFYTGSLSNRREPEFSGLPPIQIVILTRWHPDDLAGRIMESQEWADGLWHHINFPAISEIPDTEPVQYKALWEQRFDLEYLQRERAKSVRDFEALYQQRPAIQGGNLIKSEWFNTYEERDEQYASIIITADTAFQSTEASDYSVFMVSGLTASGDIHILDLLRGRWDFPTAKRTAVTLSALYRGYGLRGVYVENRASGQSLIQELRNASGLSVIPYNVGNTDKVARANISLPLIEGGRVFLPSSAPWLEDFRREISQFPSGAHDDIVDAFVMAIDILSRVGISADQLSSLTPSTMAPSLRSLLESPKDPLAPRTREDESLNSLIAKGRLPRPPGWNYLSTLPRRRGRPVTRPTSIKVPTVSGRWTPYDRTRIQA